MLVRAPRNSLLFSLFASFLIGCGGPGETPGAGGSGGGGTTTHAGGAGGESAGGAGGGSTTTTETIDKAMNCVDGEEDLGTSLTAGFGRFDGTVLAVVKPTDTECFLPNSDHVVLQVLWADQAYRMVINVQSTFGDPDVLYLAADKAPAGDPWEEGWHLGASLDYPQDMGVHAEDFTAYPMLELSDKIADAITLGQKVSVYSHNDTFPSSTHKIHRNGGNEDGAIVLDPDSDAPRTLMFHFSDQNF